MTTRADSSMILLSATGMVERRGENRNGNGGIQTRRDKNGIMESVITQREIRLFPHVLSHLLRCFGAQRKKMQGPFIWKSANQNGK